jgi:hypothetical protein
MLPTPEDEADPCTDRAPIIRRSPLTLRKVLFEEGNYLFQGVVRVLKHGSGFDAERGFDAGVDFGLEGKATLETPYVPRKGPVLPRVVHRSLHRKATIDQPAPKAEHQQDFWISSVDPLGNLF